MHGPLRPASSKGKHARRGRAPQRGHATLSLPLGRSGAVVMRSESGQAQRLRQALMRRPLAGLGGAGTGVVDWERRDRSGRILQRKQGRVCVENQCRPEGAMRRGMMRGARRLSLTRRRAMSATSSLSASVLIKGIAHAPDSCVHAGH